MNRCLFIQKKMTVYAFILIIIGNVLGCSESPADKEFLRKVDTTKQLYKASDVKAASVKLCSNANPNDFSPNRYVPKEISFLPFFSGSVDMISAEYITNYKDRPNIMWLRVGSGFGYSGLVLCPSATPNEEDQKVLNGFAGTLVPWEDGVYFWADWHVRGVPKKYWNEQ